MPEAKPRSLYRRFWWAPILVAAVTVGGVFWFKRKPGGKPPGPGERGAGPVAVVAVRARKSDMGVYLTGLGTITPLKTVTVRSRVDGQLMSLHFTESQLVQEGQLLAVIDPRPFEAALAQAEGQMAKDRALLDNARVDLERYRTLMAQDAVPKQQLDTQAALVRQYEAALKVDAGLVDSAKLQMRYSRVVSPITGKTGLRLVDPGNIIRASDANGIVVVAQLQPITAIFSLPEDSLPAVRKQMRTKKNLPVEAFDRSQKVRLATGTLTAIDNQIDTSTGTVKLKATFANRDEGLFPNQFVNIRLLVDTRKGATSVPVSAVQRGSQGMFVYVVREDKTVALRNVQTGSDDGEKVEITEGIAPGDAVVVDGTDKLREGSPVDVTFREGTQPGAPRKPEATKPESTPRVAPGYAPGSGKEKKDHSATESPAPRAPAARPHADRKRPKVNPASATPHSAKPAGAAASE